MTVREYIGARYVPLFSDPIEWDSTLVYEPLTVVKHLGASYVSKQSVPAGIGIDNENYWLLWADYNAQLEAYRNTVLTFDGRITANSDAIADFNEELGAFEDEVRANGFVTENKIADGAVTTDKIANGAITSGKLTDGAVRTPELADNAVTSAKIADGAVGTDDIANYAVTTDKIANGSITSGKLTDGAVRTPELADNAVTSAKIADGAVGTDDIANGAVTPDKLGKHNFVLFGDSWADFDGGFENWFAINNFSSVLNVNLINYAKGGAGFLKEDNLISSQITQAITDLTAEQKNATKYVVIVGMVNDIGNTSSNPLGSGRDRSHLNNAIRQCAVNAHGAFPNAQIIFAPDICSRSYGVYKAPWCFRYAREIISTDALYWPVNATIPANLPYFWVGHNASEVFRADGLHLNSVGARAFGKMILAACQGQYNTPLTAHANITGKLYLFYNSVGEWHFSGQCDASNSSEPITPSAAVSDFLNMVYFYPNGYKVAPGITGGADRTAYIGFVGNVEQLNLKGIDSTERTYYWG